MFRFIGAKNYIIFRISISPAVEGCLSYGVFVEEIPSAVIFAWHFWAFDPSNAAYGYYFYAVWHIVAGLFCMCPVCVEEEPCWSLVSEVVYEGMEDLSVPRWVCYEVLCGDVFWEVHCVHADDIGVLGFDIAWEEAFHFVLCEDWDVLHETVISSAGFYVCAMLREVWDEGFYRCEGRWVIVSFKSLEVTALCHMWFFRSVGLAWFLDGWGVL